MVRSDLTDVVNQDPNHYKSQGITDLMVSIDRSNYKTFLENVINHFKNTGIGIHAWMTVFKDVNGNFISPANWQNTVITNNMTLIDIVKDLSNISGFKGIHFDYIRYPGTANGDTSSINNFLAAAKNASPNVLRSAAVMPETDDAQVYGQDPKSMIQYLDFLCPMIYRCTYTGTDRNWMSQMTTWFNSQAPGKIVAGVCSYLSDSVPTPYDTATLLGDIQAVLAAGAVGFIIFREGLSNFLGVTSEPTNNPTVWKPYNIRLEQIQTDSNGCFNGTNIIEVHQDETGSGTCGPSSSAETSPKIFGVPIDKYVFGAAEKTDTGTAPANLISGYINVAAQHGVKLEGVIKNFSDVGWTGLGQLVAHPDYIVIVEGMTAGLRQDINGNSIYTGDDEHYVAPKTVCINGQKIEIADPDRDLIWYSFDTFAQFMSLESNPSLLILQRVG